MIRGPKIEVVSKPQSISTWPLPLALLAALFGLGLFLVIVYLSSKTKKPIVNLIESNKTHCTN